MNPLTAWPCSTSPCSITCRGPAVTVLADLRRWLRSICSIDLRFDAELVCTELVTNAIEHGGGPTEVRLAVHDNQYPMLGVALAGLPLAGVRIEVDDATPFSPSFRRSGPPDTAGWGLNIVDALASWGVRPTAAGKTVWAAVSTTAIPGRVRQHCP